MQQSSAIDSTKVEYDKDLNFSAFWKLAEKYSLVGMNHQGTLGRVY